jgi:hypothetical protein
LFEEDAIHFQTCKTACDKHNPEFYPKYKNNVMPISGTHIAMKHVELWIVLRLLQNDRRNEYGKLVQLCIRSWE